MSTVSLAQQQFPTGVESIRHELERSEKEASELTQGLTDAQLNTQPADGGWTIAQCLDHLSQVNTAYTEALRAAIRQAGPAGASADGLIHPGWFSRFFIRTMDAPPRRKVSAPKRVIPSPHIKGGDALKSFVDSHEDIRALLHESGEVDLNQIRFKNPFVGLLRLRSVQAS